MSNLTGVQFIFIIMIVIVLVSALYNIYLLGKLKSGKKDRSSVEDVKHSDNSIMENVEEPAEDINKINSILMERAIELGSINQLSEKINSTLDPDEVIQSACDELVKIFPVESAGIALLDRDKKKLITKVFKTGAAGRTDDIEAELDLANNKLFSDVIKSRRPAVIETEAAPNEKRCVLIVPVISSMETTGYHNTAGF